MGKGKRETCMLDRTQDAFLHQMIDTIILQLPTSHHSIVGSLLKLKVTSGQAQLLINAWQSRGIRSGVTAVVCFVVPIRRSNPQGMLEVADSGSKLLWTLLSII